MSAFENRRLGRDRRQWARSGHLRCALRASGFAAGRRRTKPAPGAIAARCSILKFLHTRINIFL
jgi:hypothetical protein